MPVRNHRHKSTSRAVCVVIATTLSLHTATAASAKPPLIETVTVAERQQAVRNLIKRLTRGSPQAKRPRSGATADKARPYRVARQHLASETAQTRNGRDLGPVTIDLTRAVRFDMFFGAGASDISKDGSFMLGMVAEALKTPALADRSFMIGGHTDAAGQAAKNTSLSLARARAVYDVLVDTHGIAPTRLVAAGFGESRLLNKAAPRSVENRKIELAVRVEADADRVARARPQPPVRRTEVPQAVSPSAMSPPAVSPPAVKQQEPTVSRRGLRIEDIWHVEPTLAPTGRR